MMTENLVGSIVEFEYHTPTDNEHYDEKHVERGTVVWIGTTGKYHNLTILIKTEDNEIYEHCLNFSFFNNDRIGKLKDIKFIKIPQKTLTRPELMDLK